MIEDDSALGRELIRADAPDRGIKIAVTEWNTTAGDAGPRRAMLWTLANASACSRYHDLLHRQCDMVEIADWSDLIFGANRQRVPVWTLADRLHAGEPDVANSFAEPDRVAPVRTTFRARTARFDYTFPSLSLTVLRWKSAGFGCSRKRAACSNTTRLGQLDALYWGALRHARLHDLHATRIEAYRRAGKQSGAGQGMPSSSAAATRSGRRSD